MEGTTKESRRERFGDPLPNAETSAPLLKTSLLPTSSHSTRYPQYDIQKTDKTSDDYDLHTRMSSKIFPLPIPLPSSSSTSTTSTTSTTTTPTPNANASKQPSDPSGPSKPTLESTYTVRSLPIKIYLPDNAPVIQEIIPPFIDRKYPYSGIIY